MLDEIETLGPLFACRGLARSVVVADQNQTLFADVNLTLRGGEIVHLEGASGSGKTSLLRCLVGLDALDMGVLSVDGREIGSKDASRLRGTLCYVPQLPRVQAKKVSDYIDEPSWFRLHKAKTLNRVQLQKNLEILGLPVDVLDQTCTHLSGGERKRLAFARALHYDYRALFLDEPSAGLDSKRVHAMLQLVWHFVQAGGAAVIASHDLDALTMRANKRWLVDAQTVLEESL